MQDDSKKIFKILLAEDLENDRLLLRLALRHTSFLHIVGEVVDGIETIAYLSGEGPFNDRAKHPFPDLLLLDLKMPGMDGFQVLEWLQTQRFPSLKVIVLSSSLDRADIQKSYQCGADFYQAKPLAPEDRHAMLKTLERFLVHSSNVNE